MKSLLIPILLLALLSFNSLKNTSEVNDQYKPLKKFKPLKDAEIGSDTADYLTYNFITHKEKYIGKPLGTLIKDLRINIVGIYFMPIYFDRAHCENIRINLYSQIHVRKGVEYILYIEFKEKFNYKELYQCQYEDNFDWGEKQFLFLKDKIIKNIVISDSRNWNKKTE